MKWTFWIPHLLLLVPSCSVLPKDEEPEEPGLTKYQKAHEAFKAQPNIKSLIYKNEELLPLLTPETSRIEITLSERRARVLNEANEVAIDTPVSPGKKSHPTPTGTFSIIGKKKDKRSNLYGVIYNESGGRVAGSDIRKSKIPPGGKFVGASMPYWMRLTNTGIGMHVGYVPTYSASHGCIRMPRKIAPVIYEKTKVGTPVVIKH